MNSTERSPTPHPLSPSILSQPKIDYYSSEESSWRRRILSSFSLSSTYWSCRLADLIDGAFVDLMLGAFVDLMVGALVDLTVGAFVDLILDTLALDDFSTRC